MIRVTLNVNIEEKKDEGRLETAQRLKQQLQEAGFKEVNVLAAKKVD